VLIIINIIIITNNHNVLYIGFTSTFSTGREFNSLTAATVVDMVTKGLSEESLVLTVITSLLPAILQATRGRVINGRGWRRSCEAINSGISEDDDELTLATCEPTARPSDKTLTPPPYSDVSAYTVGATTVDNGSRLTHDSRSSPPPIFGGARDRAKRSMEPCSSTIGWWVVLTKGVVSMAAEAVALLASLLMQSTATGSFRDASTVSESDRQNLAIRGCFAGG